MANTGTVATGVMPDGTSAWLVSCSCKGHRSDATHALVRRGPATEAQMAERAHGFVTMAWSPAGGLAARMPRPNVLAATPAGEIAPVVARLIRK